VHALEAAGDLARGATLYCTLEPCAHHGRTPPCAPRVADAGSARAVIAMVDPNPKVSGQGIALLRARGVTVDVGLCETEAARANAPFLTWVTKRRPHVTLKIAMSEDGIVGLKDERLKLTGAAMDRLMHRQRAEVDAIAIGAGTLLADDPLLTPRGAFRERPLTRVVFDWRLRCTGERRLYQTLDAGPVVIMTTHGARAANEAAARSLEQRGIEILALPSRDLAAALVRLAERPILSLLVEGGPALQEAFAGDGLVDRVQTIIVPRCLGGGVPAPRLLALEERLAEPLVIHAGADRLLEADVYRAD
jgi:diaminohydroxyphosphoribosylaminopyrimidine deaminase/5-amino-6-(5-phosphoribosylamino)uracil reductase